MLKLILITRYESQHVLKEIVCCYSSRSRYKESFQYRILNYFEKTLNTSKILQRLNVSSQVRENIPKIKKVKQEFESTLNHTLRLSDGKDQQVITKQTIYDLDAKCLSMIDSLNYSEILNLLTALLKIFPNTLKVTNFYNKSILLLLDAIEMELLSNHEVVQLLFFISLQKEKGAVYINYLKPYLPDLTELSLMEQCIIAQAFYKSSMKFQPDLSRMLEKIIEEDCENLLNDPLTLVSLCKIVRISGPSTELNLKTLSEAILKSNKPLNFVTTIHILCLYAEALIFETQVINYLVTDCIETIKKDFSNHDLRLKDVDRFFWSISHLGVTLTLNMKDVLKTYMEERLKEYKREENVGFLVNSMLCLHMLQCLNKKVVQDCLKENVFQQIFYQKFHWKVRARLQLLISLIILEIQINVPNELRKQIKIGYITSENVNLVADIGSSLVSRGIVNTSVIECPIETLIIPGVTVITDNNKFHIDILDNSTCLKNRNIPHGLMNLKSRLLSQLGYQQILINGDVFKENCEKEKPFIVQQIISSIKHKKTNSNDQLMLEMVEKLNKKARKS